MTAAPADAAIRQPGRIEFIALVAMMSAIIAYSIDSMLPAVPALAAALTGGAVDRAALVIPSFVLGLGIGTLVVGPLSDRFGRRPVILWGFGLFILAALAASLAPSLPALLAARVVMGLGAAAPRIVSLAIVRDRYHGAEMAQITSLAMMVFMVVPAAAPAIGQVVLGLAGWPAVFWSCAAVGLLAALWFAARQPETLPARRDLTPAMLWSGAREVASQPAARAALIAQSAVFGALFGTLTTVQPLFDQTFGRGDSFPAWFALIALISAAASLLNAVFVSRVGMLRLVVWTFVGQVALSAAVAVAVALDLMAPPFDFAATFLWISTVFAMAGLTMGNLTALALERLGHLAGLAASVLLAASTVAGALIAAPLGLAFDGTALPLALGVLACSVAGLLAVRRLQALGPQRS
jgi:DHA1 family bicyclomycin/chloramphenicol resistance-like MFS transporter